MKQMQVPGVIIKEYTERSNDIQSRIQLMLLIISVNFQFTWTAPLHDIVRRLMNEVHEFQPAIEEQL